ncbi:dihydrofolate reductase family protein [Streptomyces sp. NPDC003006]
MGHGTYRPALAHGTPSPYAHLRQYVVSNTLGSAPDSAVTVVGGGRLAAAVLPELDELIVKSYPVVAGAGIPVFGGEFDPTTFRVNRRESFPNDVTITWFTVPRQGRSDTVAR